MKTLFNPKLAQGYKSASQKIRVLTEGWVDAEIFCPNCGTNVSAYENSRPVADFYCSKCQEEYELKSKKNYIGHKIVDGAYRTMIERLQDEHNPNFFLLSYNPIQQRVLNFFVIPKHFFVPSIIERRKPLAETARRARWVGCNILLQSIPHSGKIFYVKNGELESRDQVLKNWRRTLFLREAKKEELRGWILDVMSCIDRQGKSTFTLNEIYAFENWLAQKHPNNGHIKDKIRQQLQLLRDRGYLRFVERGVYQLV